MALSCSGSWIHWRKVWCAAVVPCLSITLWLPTSPMKKPPFRWQGCLALSITFHRLSFTRSSFLFLQDLQGLLVFVILYLVPMWGKNLPDQKRTVEHQLAMASATYRERDFLWAWSNMQTLLHHSYTLHCASDIVVIQCSIYTIQRATWYFVSAEAAWSTPNPSPVDPNVTWRVCSINDQTWSRTFLVSRHWKCSME